MEGKSKSKRSAGKLLMRVQASTQYCYLKTPRHVRKGSVPPLMQTSAAAQAGNKCSAANEDLLRHSRPRLCALRVLCFGFGVFGFVFWDLGFVFCVLCFGFCGFGFGFGVLDLGFRAAGLKF